MTRGNTRQVTWYDRILQNSSPESSKLCWNCLCSIRFRGTTMGKNLWVWRDTVRRLSEDMVGYMSVPPEGTLFNGPYCLCQFQCHILSSPSGLQGSRSSLGTLSSLWKQERIFLPSSPHSILILSWKYPPGEHVSAFWRRSVLQPLSDHRAF